MSFSDSSVMVCFDWARTGIIGFDLPLRNGTVTMAIPQAKLNWFRSEETLKFRYPSCQATAKLLQLADGKG